MAETSSSFDEWIRLMLNELQSDNADMSDFVEYLMGILTSDSETDEEKRTAIVELLADLDLKRDHNTDNLSQQILDRWYQLHESNDRNSTSSKSNITNNQNDEAINNALINAMNQMESTVRQQKQSDYNSTKLTSDDALKKHKSQVLAKYSEISDEEIDYGDECKSHEDDLFHNTNAQAVEDREKKARDLQHEMHKKQQEKNKTDATNQKQKEDERKKKAQQRTQKQERRR